MKAPKKLFCKSQAKRECSIWRICVKSGRSRVGGRISSCFDYANRTRSIHLSSANPSQFVFCCCHVDNIRSRCALVLRVNLSYPRGFFFLLPFFVTLLPATSLLSLLILKSMWEEYCYIDSGGLFELYLNICDRRALVIDTVRCHISPYLFIGLWHLAVWI